VKTPVRIINEPVKMGWVGDALVMEVHPVLEVAMPQPEQGDAEENGEEPVEEIVEVVEVVEAKDPLTYVTEQFIATTAERAGQLDWDLAEQLVERSDGIPVTVGEGIKNAAASAAFE